MFATCGRFPWKVPHKYRIITSYPLLLLFMSPISSMRGLLNFRAIIWQFLFNILQIFFRLSLVLFDNSYISILHNTFMITNAYYAFLIPTVGKNKKSLKFLLTLPEVET
jgi:hypothetical protein